MAEKLQFEFPPDTSELIETLAKKLNLKREDVVAKGLGLLQLWAQAHDARRIIVERPQPGNPGEEYQIDINS